MAGNSVEPGVGQGERIRGILDAFDAGHKRLTFTQVVSRSGLPKSTCHRMLGELSRLGFLQADEQGRYAIGRRVWEWGQLAPVESDLRRIALPFMQDLLAATRQIVNLFTLDGNKALLIERISGSAVGSPIAAPGEHLSLFRSAAGKALLVASTGSTDEAWGRVTGTPDLGVSEAEARLELDRVRRQGWASTAQTHARGTWGLAVPLPPIHGGPPAALGVVSLSEIRDPSRVVPALAVTASAIARAVQRQMVVGL